MKRIQLTLVLFLITTMAMAQFHVASPDSTVKVHLTSSYRTKSKSKFLEPERMYIDVFFDGKLVVRRQEIGLTVKTRGHHRQFGQYMVEQCVNKKNQMDAPQKCDAKLSDMEGAYNSIVLKTALGVNLEVRAYNNGMAYRFTVLEQSDRYKILQVLAPLPHEHPIAILGTYDDEHSLPWRFMTKQRTETEREDVRSDYPRCGVVSWTDALSSFTLGVSTNWLNGDTWRGTGEFFSYSADVTYKYLYAGVGFTPSQELLYIHRDHDYYPFDKVMGSVRTWEVSARIGASLPVQYGHNIFNISPYVTGTLMHLYQRGAIHPIAKPLDLHHHYLVGPGIKVQCAIRERIVFGMNYEYQFFIGAKAPYAKNSLGVSFGYLY